MNFIGISVAKIAKWTVRIDVVSGVMENLSSKQGFKRSACGRLGRQTVERPIVRAAVQLAAQPASCSPGKRKRVIGGLHQSCAIVATAGI